MENLRGRQYRKIRPQNTRSSPDGYVWCAEISASMTPVHYAVMKRFYLVCASRNTIRQVTAPFAFGTNRSSTAPFPKGSGSTAP